jgi:hypothetical protein
MEAGRLKTIGSSARMRAEQKFLLLFSKRSSFLKERTKELFPV